MLLQLVNQDLGYDRGLVLRDVSVAIHEGDRIALVGESGAGKSTLLSAIQARLHEQAALVPQNPGLVGALSVFHNIYMGRLNRRPTWYNLLNLAWPRRREVDAIRPLVARLGLEEKLFEPAAALSGGQQQRVAVCRALHQGGKIVLGDEPVSAVDSHQSRTVLDALHEHFDTVVLAMHDVELALSYATRIIGLQNGGIVFDRPSAGLTVTDLDFLYKDCDENCR
ncbi:MAG: ATP-binding cassette domain-containing protein [Gammaproteobacteria bacterium]|nr:ATP-binding cassette domain-containing protein [Gammaproteobacteria bacterium]